MAPSGSSGRRSFLRRRSRDSKRSSSRAAVWTSTPSAAGCWRTTDLRPIRRVVVSVAGPSRRPARACGPPTTTCWPGCPVSKELDVDRDRERAGGRVPSSACTTCCRGSRRNVEDRRGAPPVLVTPPDTGADEPSRWFVSRDREEELAGVRARGGAGRRPDAPPSSFSGRCRTSTWRAPCSPTPASPIRRSTRCRSPPSRSPRRST